MIYEYAYRKALAAQEQVTSSPSREALVLHTSSGYKLAKSLGSVLRTPYSVPRLSYFVLSLTVNFNFIQIANLLSGPVRRANPYC